MVMYLGVCAVAVDKVAEFLRVLARHARVHVLAARDKDLVDHVGGEHGLHFFHLGFLFFLRKNCKMRRRDDLGLGRRNLASQQKKKK